MNCIFCFFFRPRDVYPTVGCGVFAFNYLLRCWNQTTLMQGLSLLPLLFCIRINGFTRVFPCVVVLLFLDLRTNHALLLVLCVCGGNSISQDRATALMRAAVHGHTDCAQLLIDAGADKEAKNNVHHLSLHLGLWMSQLFALLSLPSLFALFFASVWWSFVNLKRFTLILPFFICPPRFLVNFLVLRTLTPIYICDWFFLFFSISLS